MKEVSLTDVGEFRARHGSGRVLTRKHPGGLQSIQGKEAIRPMLKEAECGLPDPHCRTRLHLLLNPPSPPGRYHCAGGV
jgi:hypothetical protein